MYQIHSSTVARWCLCLKTLRPILVIKGDCFHSVWSDVMQSIFCTSKLQRVRACFSTVWSLGKTCTGCSLLCSLLKAMTMDVFAVGPLAFYSFAGLDSFIPCKVTFLSDLGVNIFICSSPASFLNSCIYIFCCREFFFYHISPLSLTHLC